jgi:2-oxoglutarate dehydrogenase E2 component (dihydrolipoamide succinyltransferase)
MNIEIKVPSVGESITEGTVGSILKPSGSQVKIDDEIFELETDKVNQAVYATAAGKLTLNIKSGDTVKVGQVVGSIDSEGKGAAAAPAVETKAAPPAAAPTPAPAPEKTESPGPGIRLDIDESLQQKKEEPPRAPPSPTPQASIPSSPNGRESRQKMSKLRRVISQRLVQVKNETAMLTTFNEIDMSAVMEVRNREKDDFLKKHGVKLGFMSFFVKACVAALKEFPEINGRIEGDEIVYHHYYNVGIAVGTEKGLMVPVLRDADQLSSVEIEKKLKDYAEKARSGKISVDDLQGGTFTITNGGVYGSMLSTPILNPPQSGIFAMHNIVKRAVVINDKIEIRPIMYIAMSYDHRIVDGKDSIGFLVNIKKNLEEPARLLLDL